MTKFLFESIVYYTMKSSVTDSIEAGIDYDSMPSPTGAKTLALLDLLSHHPEGLSASEASRRSGFTQNLVFRILKTLVQMGFAVQREDNKLYTLSQRLLELSAPRLGEKSLALCSHEALRELRDATGETVQLIMEADGKTLVLEQFRGTHALQVSGEVGMRVPLYSCAPGKAILAAWNEERLSEWYRGRGKTLKSFTPTTLCRREDLEKELETIRLQGYAVDRAEGVEGIHCVAVVIRDVYEQPVGAITVMAPAARLTETEFPEFASLCQKAARNIEMRLRA